MEFDYLDTGALYRAVALQLRKRGLGPEAPDDAIRGVLSGLDVTFRNGCVFLNGTDVSDTIRTTEIDYYSSVFSARKIVRDFLLEAQRASAMHQDLVVEGRDTTTVVFPDAWKKIYLDASLRERAGRRRQQFLQKGICISMDEAEKAVGERDLRDSSRDIAPLQRAPDAVFIDSSDMTVTQVAEKILELIKATD
jgi:cytidylate kinase